MGEFIVIAVLGAVVALAARSVWKGHKNTSCCGDCCKCHGSCK